MAARRMKSSRRLLEAIEDSYELEKNNGTDMQRTFYLMAYTLSGQKLLLLMVNKYEQLVNLPITCEVCWQSL